MYIYIYFLISMRTHMHVCHVYMHIYVTLYMHTHTCTYVCAQHRTKICIKLRNFLVTNVEGTFFLRKHTQCGNMASGVVHPLRFSRFVRAEAQGDMEEWRCWCPIWAATLWCQEEDCEQFGWSFWPRCWVSRATWYGKFLSRGER